MMLTPLRSPRSWLGLGVCLSLALGASAARAAAQDPPPTPPIPTPATLAWEDFRIHVYAEGVRVAVVGPLAPPYDTRPALNGRLLDLTRAPDQAWAALYAAHVPVDPLDLGCVVYPSLRLLCGSQATAATASRTLRGGGGDPPVAPPPCGPDAETYRIAEGYGVGETIPFLVLASDVAQVAQVRILAEWASGPPTEQAVPLAAGGRVSLNLGGLGPVAVYVTCPAGGCAVDLTHRAPGRAGVDAHTPTVIRVAGCR